MRIRFRRRQYYYTPRGEWPWERWGRWKRQGGGRKDNRRNKVPELPGKLRESIMKGGESLRIAVIMALFLICTAFALAGNVGPADNAVGSYGSANAGGTGAAAVPEDAAGGEVLLEEDEEIILAVLEAVPEGFEDEDLDSDVDVGIGDADFGLDVEDSDADDLSYVPGPSVLNMAYTYGEGADTSDVMQSYAGMAYSRLMSENAGLYSSFYVYNDQDPVSVAAGMGIGAGALLGGYDPTNPSHDPEDPSTWTVGGLRSINVSFYDGDGRRINGYYAVQEVMSLASVYMYFHQEESPEYFAEYCGELLDNAISYSTDLSEVYYDTGCLVSDSEKKEAWEELYEGYEGDLAEAAGAEELSAAADAASGAVSGMASASGAASGAVSGTASGAASGVVSGTASGETGADESEDYEGSLYDGGGSAFLNATILNGKYEFSFTDESEEAGQTGPSAGSSGDTSEDGGTSVIITIDTSEDTSVARDESNATEESETTYAVFSSGNVEESKAYVDEDGSIVYNTAASSEGSGDADDGAGEDQEDGIAYGESYGSGSGTGSVSGTASGSGSGAAAGYQDDEEDEGAGGYHSGSGSSDEDSDVGSDGEAGGSGTVLISYESYVAWLESMLNAAGIEADADEYCPGHVDVNVIVRIRGIDDHLNSLFDADSIGNSEESFNDSWQGWTEEMKGYARELSSQDWNEEYGIFASSVGLADCLTADEVDYYMSMLEEDTTPLRRSIVRFALESVGRVPYYWGGKPSVPGYDGNNFFRLVQPDYIGRILKGLDCSGWINWVYWSVTGSSLPGQNTINLVSCGSATSRSGLKAGDIILRLGEDSHVVMFLYWNGDGTFTGIHESAGGINNVNVSRMTADWPYYRSLAD